jgi:chemotaxis protein methyltransferase CheR
MSLGGWGIEPLQMDEDTFRQVSERLKPILGLDLSSYRDAQIRRRLQGWLRRSGEQNWDEAIGRLESDGHTRDGLRDYLAINVSEFFRDPAHWKALKEHAVAQILAGRSTAGETLHLRAWSAACSAGQEAYSLAMLLREALPASGSAEILATDIDGEALKRAMDGGPYPESEMKNVHAGLKERYFEARANGYWAHGVLKEGIEFRHADLLDLAGHEDGFDLVVCRNAIIYFTVPAKEHVLARLSRALNPGGFLFLGATEILLRPRDYGLSYHAPSLYRREP